MSSGLGIENREMGEWGAWGVVYVVVSLFSGLFIGFRMVVVGSAYAADFDVEMRQVEATSFQ